VISGLVYPTAITFDEAGRIYVAEAGYSYGDEIAPARVSVLVSDSEGDLRRKVLTDQLFGPVTDILWHAGRMYVSHRGRISVLQNGKIRDLVTGLPSWGDHFNGQMAVGADGKLYFGQGTATNSGVVGLDNFHFGWLAKYPQVHDIPAGTFASRRWCFRKPIRSHSSPRKKAFWPRLRLFTPLPHNRRPEPQSAAS